MTPTILSSTRRILLYQRYKTWADAEENVHFCGRLAEYRYFDMDTVVARTLSLCDEEFGT